MAWHVLFAHPGSFACRHGEDDNEGVSSSCRALPRSTPNHETIQVTSKEHTVREIFWETERRLPLCTAQGLC